MGPVTTWLLVGALSGVPVRELAAAEALGFTPKVVKTAKKNPPAKKPAKSTTGTKPAAVDAGTPAAPTKDAGAPSAPAVETDASGELWDFDGLRARVTALGESNDPLTTMALTQLNVDLQGPAELKVSAHPNTVGGVSLRIEDPANAAVNCVLYATRTGDILKFKDCRCVFPVEAGQLHTEATCRRISGSARRKKDAILFVANAPDCTAQPMGLAVSVRANAVPRD